MILEILKDTALTFSTIIGAVGGWEAVKYMINRRPNSRKAEAEADSVEFTVLRQTVEFLQQQLQDKEERFAKQTEQLRALNTDVLNLTKEKSKLELTLQQQRCVRRNCPDREPQNGY